MVATEISSNVYQLTIFKKAISDLIYDRQWREAIEEELQNLELKNTWEYNEVPSGRAAIGSKYIFKVKY